MTNEQIADVFEQMAQLLEFQGANAFRVRAYRNAARTIGDLTEPLASIAATPGRSLTDLEGIGDDLAAKIQTLLTTGVLPQHQELLAKVPVGVGDLLRVPGLGPKKAAALFKELGVKNLADLRRVCESHEVQKLKGFGAKTEQTILKGLEIAESANQRLLWRDADVIVRTLLAYLRDATGVKRIEAAGSYRRGKETVGDLDLLVATDAADNVMDALAGFPQVQDLIGRGDAKMSVRMVGGLRVDLLVIPGEIFGAALHHFTGSKDHNVVIRNMAKDRGLKVSEYGVHRGETLVAGRTEEEVFEAVGLPWIAPELREARKEFEWAKAGKLPRLIELDDLQGDLHMHTTYTDGRNTIEEMVATARRRGLKYVAITDHSKRVTVAGGLTGERLREQWAELERVREKFDDMTILKGIECDILEAGGMDLPDDVLAEADWVVASVHFGQNQPREQITKRILDAIKHPSVSVIAHPTGRLLNTRRSYELDLDAVIKAARDHGKMLELNASPERLDLDDVACAAAREHQVPIVISSDAHSVNGFEVLRYGVQQARRAGLSKADVANARPWKELQKLLPKNR